MAKRTPAKPKADQSAPEVSVVPIANFGLDPRNAMDHPLRNQEVVTSSLKRFGPGRSIVVKDGTVIAGNCTIESAAEAGFTDVITVKPGPHQLVAVDRSDWTAEEATQYGLADNRSSQLASFKNEVLIDQIDAMPLELADELGWTEVEIAAIRLDLWPLPDDKDDEPLKPTTETTNTCPSCGHQWKTSPE